MAKEVKRKERLKWKKGEINEEKDEKTNQKKLKVRKRGQKYFSEKKSKSMNEKMANIEKNQSMQPYFEKKKVRRILEENRRDKNILEQL